jgi:hypothetical protein
LVNGFHFIVLPGLVEISAMDADIRFSTSENGGCVG